MENNKTNNEFFKREIIVSNKKGRVTKITTPHGSFFTPNFFFCGTNGTIKNCDIRSVKMEKTNL